MAIGLVGCLRAKRCTFRADEMHVLPRFARRDSEGLRARGGGASLLLGKSDSFECLRAVLKGS